MVVCTKFHSFPFLKQLTFYRNTKFELEARYDTPDIPADESLIGTFMVDKVAPQPSGDSSKVKVKVRVNGHGIFSVSGASMTEKIEVTAEESAMDVDGVAGVALAADKTAVNGAEEDGKKKGESPTGDGKENKEESTEKKATATENGIDENGPNSDKKEEEATGDKDSKKAGSEQNKKQKLKVIDLPVVPRVPRMSKEDINLLMEKEGQMIMQDKLEKERMDAKNAVEEYVYDMRKKVCGDMEAFILEKDREEFLRQLEETENWLYEDGEDLGKQMYIDRLAALKKHGSPVVERYREASERPGAFESLGQTIQLLTKVVNAYESKDEKYEHIDAAEMEKVKNALTEKSDWFERHFNLANKQPPHLPPPVTVAQIKSQRDLLQSTCNPIVNKPKPKPPKIEPPNEEAKPAEDAPAGDKAATGEGSETDEKLAPETQRDAAEGSRVDMDLD
jgi:hypothetical protein